MARNEVEPGTRPELIAALEVMRSKLERADEIENPIERFFQFEQLCEQIDLLEADIAEFDSDN